MSDRFHRRLLSGDVRSFLVVGGLGYVVDLAAFNALRLLSPFDRVDPSIARILAMLAAMCVTYVGNRTWTWSSHTTTDHRREIGLFILFNAIALSFSVLALLLSHDLLGLTSRLADNVSANGIGLALGTAFRYLTYKRFVFSADPCGSSDRQRTPVAAEVPRLDPVGHPG
jgi:putative flippase GtrA